MEESNKIKELFIQFSEDFNLSSFFCITTTYYKEGNRLRLKALGKYKYELDMYLIEKRFLHERDVLYNWDEYKKGNVEIILMERYK